MTDPSESVTRFKGSVPIGTTRPAGRIRQPEGSNVDPSGSEPGTRRVARSAAPAIAGSASRERLSMGRNMAARGSAGIPLALGAMTGLIFHLIPHTHWDREWYLPRAALQARLVAVTGDLIERLQAQPAYRSFLLDGQTVLVEDYLRACPDREGDLRTLVKTGRLQVGPWYVLPDEQIPSGEGLVRNLLLGAADAERWGGRLDVLYSPDAFGHPAAWPTLAREFGIRYGVVWRGLGGEAGRRWSSRYAWTLQGGHATRAPLKRRYGEAELALRRLAEPLAALARRAGGRDRRPLLELAWRGLVRCQFHDSIAGCASDAVARAVETRLGGVEALASEIVRGSVHDLVRHDPDAARARPADARPTLVLWNPAARPRRGVAIADVTLFRRDVLVGPPGSPGPPGRVPRVGEGYRSLMLATADGRAIPVQVLDRRIANERLDAQRHYPDQDEVDQVRIAVRAPPLAGLGLATVAIATGASAPGARPSGEGVHVKGRSLVNHWIEVALEPTGALALHDRRSGQRFAELLRIEDGGDAGDTYSYCPPAGDRVMRAAGPIKLRRLAAGPLVAALKARFELRPRAGVRLLVMLHADGPLIRCILEIENRTGWHRLRARLPTDLAGTPAVAGTAFGTVARPAVAVPAAAYPLETPVRTAPAHRFVAAASGPRGP